MDQKHWGTLLIVIGAFGILIALNMDTSVSTEYGDVNNIGLMNDKTNYLIVSGLIAACGLALFLFGTRQGTDPQLGLRKCPACAEMIKAEAVKCRFCGTEVTPLAPSTTIQIDPSSPDEMTERDLENVADFYGIKPDKGEFVLGERRFATLADAIRTARQDANRSED